MYEITRNVLAEVKKAIVGKDDVISKVWIALLAEGHVLLEDVPGVGKTTMALAFSRALGLDTKRIQFTPDTMPSDIIGFSMPGKDGMVYQPGAIMTNLLLADEINRTSSKTQSALLEAMEEGQVTVDRVTHPLPRPFAVLATQNPVGSAGTQDLPNSQLDRFLMKLSMGYPDLQSQIHILRDRSGEDPLTRVQAVADRDALCEAIRRVRAIHIADPVYDYIARLTEATRSHPMVRLGISPRGALALCRCAKAAAFAAGRDFVLPEDAAELLRRDPALKAHPALRAEVDALWTERAVRITSLTHRFVEADEGTCANARKHVGLSLTLQPFNHFSAGPNTPVNTVDSVVTTLCITIVQPCELYCASQSSGGVWACRTPVSRGRWQISAPRCRGWESFRANA